MLSIKNVTKTFGDIKALEDVSFDVGEGEFLFICGPSGAGKTTILRLILRELFPDSGEIILEGRDITKIAEKEVPSLRQQIGVVFQDFKVLPERTLKENVEVALAVIGTPQKDWDTRVEHVLKLVGLINRKNLFPSQLSGGELQRVSLARALVVNPKIILADEPTGNLDWDTAEKLMELFEQISKEGKSVIMATHHQLLVDRHINVPGGKGKKRKVISLDKGKIADKNSSVKKGKDEVQKTDEKGTKKQRDLNIAKTGSRIKVRVEEK